ncbi:ABC transporter permease [Bariatricus massiliensis]|uniref:ABC transporter permease n=1 Tax=Bariatricus massiliensis TaxID=1745713 RepID=A0ABS8DMK5_9FIRM|nr:ABC transporter permease subunit [Bariatricus massiliensis]MCB7303158.1 ABC transporter permease [Bariatricus massiliensis]MCB7376609.1 ABC transporter permease [Bariatricus massiliensis]MCB7389267.1 ABC transporter permease [Bariatricus massiliensis]MCB7413453.1 ABC transporter permease [Bariatricus massiliensis]MCQ5252032.1 ABC transporter permease [Bariatricus massiliensis]
MNVTGRLYVYEIRKIIHRKIVWIAGAVMVLLCVFLSVSDLVSSVYDGEISGYERMKIVRQYARNLSGRRIDDTLLKEMQDSYREGAAEGEVRAYLPIYMFVQDITGADEVSQEIDSEGLYLMRQDSISQNRADQMLTEKERQYWSEKDSKIETPFTYEYGDGWSNLWEYAYTINYMLLLMITISLSNVFSMEHFGKTDAIILCSQYGKKQLYLAKILAGITFGAVTAIILFGVSAVSSIAIYGADGFHTALQIAFPMSSWTMSIGGAVLVLLFILILVSVLYSIVIMFLSEALKNSVAVMAIPVGIMILTMLVDIPYQFRLVSQIYDLLPTNLLTAWELWDDRLVSVFGKYLTNFQIAPIIYCVTAALLFFVGKRIYERYQIGAR